MKRSIKRTIAALLAALTISGCASLTAGAAEKEVITADTNTGITLNSDGSPIVLTVGTKFALPEFNSTLIKGFSLKVTGVSNNCLTVKDGVVEAVNAGTCTLTITLPNGQTFSPTFIINMPAVSFSFKKIGFEMGKGEITNITKLLSDYVGDITWISSDSTVVKVRDDGQLIAKKTGDAVITAALKTGEKASINVTVKKAPKTLTFSKSSVTLKVGQSKDVEADINSGSASCNIKYISSSPKTVSVDPKTGKLTAKNAGKAVITAKAPNGTTATYTVYVKALPCELTLNKTVMTLNVNQKKVLTATLPSGKSAGKLRFAALDDSIISVDSNGLVKAIRTGTAYVKVKSEEGFVAYCKVKVV